MTALLRPNLAHCGTVGNAALSAVEGHQNEEMPERMEDAPASK
jgi:hypothetical protein